MNVKTKFLIPLVIFSAIYAIAASFNFSRAQSGMEIDASAYIVSSKDNEAVSNGEYDVRFAIYAVDRETADPYPSNSDARVWEETQKIYINDGILNAYLGATVPLPASLNFGETTYYLGIRIGTDSEMTPRKKIGAVPLAIDSYFLRGATTGTDAGNIPQLSSGGKMDIKLLPTGDSGKKLV